MFLKVKTVSTEMKGLQHSKKIKISSKDIDEINKKIQVGVREKEIEREKGLEVAVRCRMR